MSANSCVIQFDYPLKILGICGNPPDSTVGTTPPSVVKSGRLLIYSAAFGRPRKAGVTSPSQPSRRRAWAQLQEAGRCKELLRHICMDKCIGGRAQ